MLFASQEINTADVVGSIEEFNLYNSSFQSLNFSTNNLFLYNFETNFL